MQQIGPYTLLDEIARGGHGVVYRAQDAQGQVVALKLLLAHRAQNEQARKRFQAEVNALARLRHPHVVPILAAGEHEGCPWLALEYVEGESLETRLRRGPLKIHEAIRVAQQLAQALSYVHSCGVLHRDLKPDNVLLRGDEALLTDFGLALDEQASVSRITATGVFQGTPGYWAPEQARGETHEHGEQTDVYGLGAVLYACLTGSAPVQAHSLQEYLQTIRFRQVPSPRKVRSDVPSWLSDLCMRCLATVPVARPGSANEAARALVLAGTGVEPVAASSRRGRLVAVLAGAIGVLGFVGLAWWSLGTESARVEPALPESTLERGPSALDPTLPEVSPDRTQQAQALVEAGKTKFSAGRYAEAIQDYDEAIKLDPQNALAYFNRGWSKQSLDRHAEGIQDYTRALELKPGMAAAYANRGVIKAHLKRHTEAIEDFTKALELNPRYGGAHTYRGQSKTRLGRHTEAVEDFTKALELNPRDVTAYDGRGMTRASLGLHAEALRDFTKALEFDPRNALAYGARGVSKNMLGRFVEAIGDYDKSLKLDPSNATAFVNRGLSKSELGRYAEAIEDYDKALELGLPAVTADEVKQWRAVAAAKLKTEGDQTQQAQALVESGGAKGQAGRYAEAIEDYDKALELDPRNAVAYTNRGASKANLGRDAEAIEDYDKALELDPRIALAYAHRGASKANLGRVAEAIEDLDRALDLGMPQATADRVRQIRAEAAAKLEGN